MLNDSDQSLVNQWLLAEANGETFPVDFETGWKLAGYSLKHHAKRRLETELILGTDFALTKSGEWSKGGRSSDLFHLTCDAFKHFCLLAKTEKGRDVRQYFIEVEKQYRQTVPNCQALTTENTALKAELDRLKTELKTPCHEPKIAITHSQRQTISAVWEQTENLHGVLTLISGTMQSGLGDRRYDTGIEEIEALLGSVNTALSVTKSICHSLDTIDRNLLVQQVKAITA